MSESNTVVTANKITPEIIQMQAADWREAADRAAQAASAYLADIEERKATLQAQAQEYKTAFDALTAERKTLAANIIDLSSRGEIDAVNEADARLAIIDRELATVGRKLKIVNAAEPKGDPTLYTAAKDAHDAMEACHVPYINRIDTLALVVDKEIKRLQEVREELSRVRTISPGYHATKSFNLVERHYKDLDRIEREVSEKAAAERKAQAAERGATRYTFC